MTKAPEGIWGIFDQFGHGSTMLRDLSQNENILTAGGNLPTKFVRADLYEAQAAEIERLAEDKRWIIDERDRTFALMLSRAEEAEAEIERLRGDLKKAEWLLVDASVQLAEGRIKTRRNRALLIRQFLAALTGAKP